jgi:hypothetical protein
LAQNHDPGVTSGNDEDSLSALFLVKNKNIELEEHPWYKDIIYYLQFQKCPNNIENYQCRRIRLEASKYLILGTSIFHIIVDGLLLHCVDDTKAQNILKQIHGSIYLGIHIGDHFVTRATTFKILRINFYWPLIFKDSYKFTHACNESQRFAGREKFFPMPLQLVLPYFPFLK